MRKSFVVSLVLGVSFSVLALPRAAQATPILITGGSITEYTPASGFDWSGFVVTGADSSFSGLILGGTSALVPLFGGVLNLSGEANPTSGPPSPYATLQVVNGTEYHAFVHGQLTFTSLPFVIPPPPPLATSFEFSAPFTATGHISGTDTLSDGAVVLFSEDLVGSGTTSIRGAIEDINFPPAFYWTYSQTFHFEPASPSAVPEPDSMLLLGTGVVGIGARRWNRRQAG